MFLFGFSMNPMTRLLVGAAVLAIGIALHLALLEAGGAAFLALGVFMLVRDVRKNTR
jgi:hypothetical protein